jgi:hypothetical protein
MRIAGIGWLWRGVAGGFVDYLFCDLRKVTFLTSLACSTRHVSSLTPMPVEINAKLFFLWL